MARNELWAQGLVVDAVNEAGGYGVKLSHRFKVGIPDLLLKLKHKPPTMILEAKMRDKPVKLEQISLWDEVTPLQHKNLREMTAAGMLTGVVSFMRGPKNTLYMNTVAYWWFVKQHGVMSVADHEQMPRFDADRQKVMIRQLEWMIRDNT